MDILTLLFVIAIVLVLISIKQINQYQRGVVLTFGKYSGIKNPGWRLIWPVIQKMQRVDMRVRTVDVPDQEAITQDNISIRVNAVLYYKVVAADKAILEVENFFYAMTQLGQTAMRNSIGQAPLDELLTQREKISEKILAIVDAATNPWGIDVTSVELKDVVLPEGLKRTMAKQAEAEREKRANIINSEGEVIAAENLAQAARTLTASPGALHLRTLNSINDISSDASNTVVFTVPMEVYKAVAGFSEAVTAQVLNNKK